MSIHHPTQLCNEDIQPAISTSKLISAIFSSFDTEAIKYCVLRGYQNLPEHYHNDIDILVKKKNCKRAIILIQTVATCYGWVKIGLENLLGYHKIYLSPITWDGRLLRLDIQSGSEWKGIPTYSVDYILRKRQQYKSFWIASKGAESVCTLLKDLLMHGRIKNNKNLRKRIQRLANEDPVGFSACLSDFICDNMKIWLLERARSGDWNTLESGHHQLRWEIIRQNMINNPVVQLFRWSQFFWLHLLRRIRNPFNIFIILLGPDGSGKTTICNRLEKFWKSSFCTRVVKVHGNFNIIPRLKNIRILFSRVKSDTIIPEPDFTKKHSGAEVHAHSMAKSLCYLSYYIWDYLLGRIWVYWHRSKGHFIVADRYFYDYFFQLGNGKLPHRLLHLFSWLIPQPDLVLYLERNPKEIYRKKDELTIAEIERQQNILRNIIKKIPNSICVNADNGIESTVKEIKNHILIRMTDRNK